MPLAIVGLSGQACNRRRLSCQLLESVLTDCAQTKTQPEHGGLDPIRHLPRVHKGIRFGPTSIARAPCRHVMLESFEEVTKLLKLYLPSSSREHVRPWLCHIS
eukprot:scaffold3820_cov415-Prasinococcus_capsulatus_cf.AAC.12